MRFIFSSIYPDPALLKLQLGPHFLYVPRGHRRLADPDVSVEITQAATKSPDAFSESGLRNRFHSAVNSNLSRTHALTIHEEACLPPSGRKRRRGVFF